MMMLLSTLLWFSISEFKNKLYQLGEYLLSKGLEIELLRLIKLSQELASGKMPGHDIIFDSRILEALSEKLSENS